MLEGQLDDYLEWVVEKDFVLGLEDAGWQCLKADRMRRGWADQFCFGPGCRVVIVEFKSSGAKSRRGEKLQAHYRDTFEAMGFDVRLVIGKEEADELLAELLVDAQDDAEG